MYIDDNFWSTQAAMALCTMSAWFWYTIFLYHSSSAVTTPSYPHSWLPSRNPLTLHWRSYTFFHPLCRFPFPASHPPLPLALTSTPPSFSSSSFPSFLEDFDNGTFLDCSHEYRGLRSDITYSLSDIFCDAFATARCSEWEWMRQSNLSLIWSVDSAVLAKKCWLCGIGVLQALICCSFFLYRHNTPTHIACRWRALWRHRLP